jgi:hypothetical protein
VRNKEVSFLQIVMLSFYLYSCCYELEYSHVDMILIYELAYSPYVMFIPYVAQCFHVHIMFMNRNSSMLRWWFIMLSGVPKSFTCRSVGSGTRGDLGGLYVCG